MIIFYIGIDKCGSTAIYNILSQQEWTNDIGAKDTNLLSNTEFDNLGITKNINTIKDLGMNSYFIEYCHDYWVDRSIAELLKANFPDCFIICSIRNPLKRSVSAVKQYIKRGDSKSISDALQRFPDIIDNSRYGKLKDFLYSAGKLDDNRFFIVDIDSDVKLTEQLNRCIKKFNINKTIELVTYDRFSAKASRYPTLTFYIKKISKLLKKFLSPRYYQSLKNVFYDQEFFFKEFSDVFDAESEKIISQSFGKEILEEYNDILKLIETS